MIHAAPEPTRGGVENTPAIHSLDHFALAVPDLDAAETFYSTFGLSVENVADGLRLNAATGATTMLREAAGRRLEYVSFNIDAGDLHGFQQRLESGGIALLDPPHPVRGDGL